MELECLKLCVESVKCQQFWGWSVDVSVECHDVALVEHGSADG